LILDALDAAGFTDVNRVLSIGLFSEYTGRKPARRRLCESG